MKITLADGRVCDVDRVAVSVPILSGTEDMPASFPGRTGNQWAAVIYLADGRLELADGSPFPVFVSWRLAMTVDDLGDFAILSTQGDDVASYCGEVPGFFPGSPAGASLVLRIANGRVTNWSQPTPKQVMDAFRVTASHAEERRIEDVAARLSIWSQRTFGSDAVRGPIGPLQHLKRECDEAIANPGDVEEFADVLLLTLDASRRAGFSLNALVAAAYAKVEKNEQRAWPAGENATDPVFHVEEGGQDEAQ
jgi:Protein of unknown function (DUF550)